jgi:hypothetical protein
MSASALTLEVPAFAGTTLIELVSSSPGCRFAHPGYTDDPRRITVANPERLGILRTKEASEARFHFPLAPLAGRGSGRGGISTHSDSPMVPLTRWSPSPEACGFDLSPQAGRGENTRTSTPDHIAAISPCKHPHLRYLAARGASFASFEAHLKFRGRRECRARDAPAASCAK